MKISICKDAKQVNLKERDIKVGDLMIIYDDVYVFLGYNVEADMYKNWLDNEGYCNDFYTDVYVSASDAANKYVTYQSCGVFYHVCKSIYPEIGAKERDLYKQQALKVTQEVYSDKNIRPLACLEFKNFPILPGISRYKSFNDFIATNMPSHVVTKEQVVKELETRYEQMYPTPEIDMQAWTLAFNKYCKSYECNAFKKYNLAYVLNNDKSISVYFYLGKHDGYDYFQYIYNFQQDNLIDLVKINTTSLVDYLESWDGFLLQKIFDNECKKAVRTPKNLRPLNLRLNVEKCLMSNKDIAKKLVYYK